MRLFIALGYCFVADIIGQKKGKPYDSLKALFIQSTFVEFVTIGLLYCGICSSFNGQRRENLWTTEYLMKTVSCQKFYAYVIRNKVCCVELANQRNTVRHQD